MILSSAGCVFSRRFFPLSNFFLDSNKLLQPKPSPHQPSPLQFTSLHPSIHTTPNLAPSSIINKPQPARTNSTSKKFITEAEKRTKNRSKIRRKIWYLHRTNSKFTSSHNQKGIEREQLASKIARYLHSLICHHAELIGNSTDASLIIIIDHRELLIIDGVDRRVSGHGRAHRTTTTDRHDWRTSNTPPDRRVVISK